MVGCTVQLNILCNKGHKCTWKSSATHYNKNGVGVNCNDLLGAAILFSGSHYAQVKRMFDILNLQCVHEKMFYR